jgi:hypothetical protein
VAGRSGTPIAAVFGRSGRVGMVVSTVSGYRAGSLRVGSPATALHRATRPGAAGVWTSRRRLRGGARYIYGLRHGRVWFVAVASRPLLRGGGVAGALRAAGL